MSTTLQPRDLVDVSTYDWQAGGMTFRARTVAGVSIGTEGEDFIVEPFEVELAPGKAVA